MRIIFMGTPDFAVPSLDILVKEGHDIIGVFTQPDKPKGRGNKITFPPVKDKALSYGIRVFQPKNLKNYDTINLIETLSPDIIIVVAYGQILSKQILNIPKHGCVNVHASLLPKYRGAAPINWAIIRGEKETGITTMFMDEGLDTGDMILKSTIKIGEKTAGELHDEMCRLGAQVLRETIELIANNNAPREQQKPEESSYAPMLEKSLGEIKWNSHSIDIYNLIRGLNPWPTAFSTYKKSPFKIWNSKLTDEKSQLRPGTIVRVDKEGIFVNTLDNILCIEEIQFPGGKRLAVKEYIKGNTIEINEVLGE